MTRRLISTGSRFEALAGYSRAVVDGDTVYVSGTTGYDYATGAISPDVAEQTEQIFRTLRTVLAEAGFSLDDVVRVVCYVADRADFATVAPILGRHFATIRPANTTVIAALVAPEIKVEIEVTARRR